jgi:hypothetical protein
MGMDMLWKVLVALLEATPTYIRVNASEGTKKSEAIK